jgi:LysM repeat protein
LNKNHHQRLKGDKDIMQQAEVVEIYNKGLQYIKAHDYERAKDILKGIALIFHDRMLIQKVIGSLEMMTGYPYLALKYWEPLIDKNVGVTEEQCMMLREQLPVYDEMQDIYSKAMQWVVIGQLSDAEQILADLFDKTKDVPIPTEMYRSYILLQLQLGKGRKALDSFKGAPQYVQLVPEMRILEVSAKKQAQEEQNVLPIKDPWMPDESQQLTRSDKNKKKMKGGAVLYYNLGIAILLLVVIVAFMTFGAKPNNKEKAVVNEQLQSENQSLKTKLAELESAQDVAYEKLSLLEKENVKLNDQLVSQSDEEKPKTPATPVTPVKPVTPEKPVQPVQPAKPVKPALPATHKVAQGDNLFRIAQKYYGDKSQWQKICEANTQTLINADPRNQDLPCEYLPLGTSISIPK